MFATKKKISDNFVNSLNLAAITVIDIKLNSIWLFVL